MWLVSHATPTSSSSSCVELSSPTHAGGTSSSGRGGSGGSGATTPVRKISAHEFERGGLLKPIVNTIDGTPTFLSVSPGDSGQPGGQQVGSGNAGRPQRRSRHELRHLDEKDLIFELVRVEITMREAKKNWMKCGVETGRKRIKYGSFDRSSMEERYKYGIRINLKKSNEKVRKNFIWDRNR